MPAIWQKVNPLISVTVNEVTQTIEKGSSISDLLRDLNIESPAIAVEVNQTLVTRDHFTERTLEAGDRVEIVTLVGGG